MKNRPDMGRFFVFSSCAIPQNQIPLNRPLLSHNPKEILALVLQHFH